MPLPSPTCTVQDGAGSPQSTVDGVDVTAGNTITIQLASLAGVRTWSISVVGTDDEVATPALSVNYTTKTATFTAPAGQWALIFQSQIDGGIDVNNQAQADYTTTFGVYSTGIGGYRLFAVNERYEGSSAFGWTTKVNALIRSLAGGSLVVPEYTTSSESAHVVATIAVPASTSVVVEIYVLGIRDQDAAQSDHVFLAYRRMFTRVASGALATNGALATLADINGGGDLAATIDVSSNSIIVHTDDGGNDATWNVEVKTMTLAKAT